VNRKVYLVLFAVLMALAATGVYVRQRAKAAAAPAANCDTPAPPPLEATPPPKLPGFAIEPACGTGAETPKASKTPPQAKTGKAK
jgi:hypothetical protein